MLRTIVLHIGTDDRRRGTLQRFYKVFLPTTRRNVLILRVTAIFPG